MTTAGRSQQQGVVKQAGQGITTGQGLENQAQNIASSEINTSGGLSPLVSKQLANNEGQIGKAYQSAAQGAERGLAQRGMSAAPSGLQASLQNSQINNAGQAKTGAIGNAFGTQNELNQTALNQRTGGYHGRNERGHRREHRSFSDAVHRRQRILWFAGSGQHGSKCIPSLQEHGELEEGN